MAEPDLDTLLAPLGAEAPCGPDLEYDPAFQAMLDAGAGKPERQYGDKVYPAEPPDWPLVHEQAAQLAARTRDLRVAVWLARSGARLRGLVGAVDGLRLVQGLVERHWEHLHPPLDASDNNDPTARVMALTALADPVTGLEVKEAAVLEEPAQDTANADALAQARQAGSQGADATHQQVDTRAGLRCRVELVDHFDVRQAVDLDADPRLAAFAGRLRDVPDLLDQSLTERERRDEELAEMRRPAEPGEVVEEIGNVGRDVFVRSEDAEVLVGLRPNSAYEILENLGHLPPKLLPIIFSAHQFRALLRHSGAQRGLGCH